MTVTGEFPLIFDDALDELRQRIGVEVRGPQPYITEVTRDAIRHWADGIGDRSPLWRDEEIAAESRWGTLIAPPTILYAFDRICSGYVGGLPGVHAMFAGTDFRWRRPPRLGDRISAVAHLSELVDLESQFSGRAVKQVYTIVFQAQDGEVICEADSWCFRTQRDVARERAKYTKEEVGPAYYSDDQVHEIAAEYGAETTRGFEPLYWDDVRAGDVLPTVLKGPLTVSSMITFDQGWGGLYLRAHGLTFDLLAQHPALGIRNANNVPEPPERVHWDSDLAARVGVPAPYDYGPERVSWLGHIMTNWIGYDGFLKRLNVQVRRHNLVGDLTRVHGVVVGTRIEDGEHLVECSLEARNQRDEITAKGTGVAVLPTRS